MKQIILKVSIVVLSLGLYISTVKSSVSIIDYKIVFSTPDIQVIKEKERLLAVYEKVSRNSDKDSIREVLELAKEELLGSIADSIEFEGNTLILYLDMDGKLAISGSFYDACESKVVKRSWLKENIFK